MVFPSGEQFAITAAGYRAVVTESGAALRVLSYGERALVDGFEDDEMSPGGRGQLLMPYPYLAVGTGIDHLELTLPAGTRILADDRLIPVETVPVDEEHDFRAGRQIGAVRFNDGYGDLERIDGVATTMLRDPADGQGLQRRRRGGARAAFAPE